MKLLYSEISFAGHIAEVSGPVTQIHINLWCVGQLDEKDLVSGDATYRIGVNLARQCMEAVKDQSHACMVGTAHNFPRIAVIIDMGAPRQGLKPDTQPAFKCRLSQSMKIGSRTVNSAKCLRMA